MGGRKEGTGGRALRPITLSGDFRMDDRRRCRESAFPLPPDWMTASLPSLRMRSVVSSRRPFAAGNCRVNILSDAAARDRVALADRDSITVTQAEDRYRRPVIFPFSFFSLPSCSSPLPVGHCLILLLTSILLSLLRLHDGHRLLLSCPTELFSFLSSPGIPWTR